MKRNEQDTVYVEMSWRGGGRGRRGEKDGDKKKRRRKEEKKHEIMHRKMHHVSVGKVFVLFCCYFLQCFFFFKTNKTGEGFTGRDSNH